MRRLDIKRPRTMRPPAYAPTTAQSSRPSKPKEETELLGIAGALQAPPAESVEARGHLTALTVFFFISITNGYTIFMRVELSLGIVRPRRWAQSRIPTNASRSAESVFTSANR